MLGNQRGAVPLVAAALAFVVLAAILLGFGSDWFSGTGEGNGSSESQPPTPPPITPAEISDTPSTPAVTRPMRIEIDGESCRMGEKTVTVEQIVELAVAVPEGTGPAVVLVRKASSRAKLEKTIKEALTAKKITFRFENDF